MVSYLMCYLRCAVRHGDGLCDLGLSMQVKCSGTFFCCHGNGIGGDGGRRMADCHTRRATVRVLYDYGILGSYILTYPKPLLPSPIPSSLHQWKCVSNQHIHSS